MSNLLVVALNGISRGGWLITSSASQTGHKSADMIEKSIHLLILTYNRFENVFGGLKFRNKLL